MLPNSTFTEIPELPSYYINREGQVFSEKSNRFLTPYLENSGYYRFSFHINGKQIRVFLHRLLANVYLNLPSIYSDLEVDHKDRDRRNNFVNNALNTNLQVLTKAEHSQKTIADRGFSVQEGFNSVCPKCGGTKYRAESAGLCKKCRDAERNSWKHENSKKEIEDRVISSSWVQAAKSYGISDNALRKRYKSLGGEPASLTKIKRM